MAFCLLPLLVIFGLYGLYLQLAAIKAVYQFGWGGAAAAFFLPTILLSLLCAVLVVGLLSLAGPSFQEFPREMQQLQP